jgi:predicted anti-sigma-YlaC factor YlaD
MTFRRVAFFVVGALAVCLNAACSIQGLAIDRIGDSLAVSGSTFSADDDPELIRAAAPFSLKLTENLLAERPQHAGLLLAAARGFTQFAYAFVQQDADALESSDVAAAFAQRDRARRLYVRARDYGLRALHVAHPGTETRWRSDIASALAVTGAADVPALYWTGAAWAGAIALSKDTPEAVADLPIVSAMLDRALTLEPGFGDGALHTLMITLSMARTDLPDGTARARQHFAAAQRLSHGQQAGPYLALAEAVALPGQDRAEFTALLKQALAIDVDANPAQRLENRILQGRARWLQGRVDDLFLE